MYYVYCDDLPILDSRDDDLALIAPKLSLEDNNAGSFEFSISSLHPNFDAIKKWTSVIRIMQDNDEVFVGRVTEEKGDFYKRKTFHCEGELAFLNDTIQPPAEYHNMTVRGYLEALVKIHNSKVDSNKQFTVGVVTVTDNNDSLYKYTNWESTMQVIKTDLIDTYGGHLRIRNVNGVRYLDYLKDYPRTSNQVIRFGENLLDFSKNFNMSDICTVLIPLGAKLDESPIEALEAYTTIESVNNGNNYLVNQAGVNKYGKIEKTVKWDGVKVPSVLKSKGQAYLSNFQYEQMVLEISAVDLHNLNADEDVIRLLDNVRAVSDVHGMDRYFPVTKIDIPLNQPSQSKFTLGTSVNVSMSVRSNAQNTELMKKIDDIPTTTSIIKEAQANASALIHSALNGHVVTRPDEILVMDTDDIETARKLWRWNLNGLGYSNTGYNGTYGLAITMDGQIVGEMIVGGSVSADKIDINYRTEVEKAITDAQSNAEDYADDQLKSYWTATEVQTQIKNTSDEILLSAKETATAYTDKKLKDYSTSAEIKIKTDAIESTVNKKLNSSDLATKIRQDATSVKIAWNNISKYIAFESGELRIYDSSVESTRKMVSKFNYSGSHFYRDGKYLGKIGTNSFSDRPEYRGLVFDLDWEAQYMCWSIAEKQNASSYTTKFVWYRDDTIEKQGFHFGDIVYFGGNFRIDENGGFYNYSDGLKLWDNGKVYIGSDGSSCCSFTGDTFTIYNNRTVDFYSPLNLHGWGYTNDSDVRMKNNIVDTKIKGLDVVNAIDLKEFDWILSGEHQEIGIIAQQLMQVAPELVVTNEHSGQLMLKTDNLVYYCLKAIQELCDRLGYKFEKHEYIDPYSYLEKKEFSLSLQSGKAVEGVPIKASVPVLPKQ